MRVVFIVRPIWLWPSHSITTRGKDPAREETSHTHDEGRGTAGLELRIPSRIFLKSRVMRASFKGTASARREDESPILPLFPREQAFPPLLSPVLAQQGPRYRRQRQ